MNVHSNTGLQNKTHFLAYTFKKFCPLLSPICLIFPKTSEKGFALTH